MNITYKIDKIKKNNWLNITFDAGKDDLYICNETGNGTITHDHQISETSPGLYLRPHNEIISGNGFFNTAAKV